MQYLCAVAVPASWDESLVIPLPAELLTSVCVDSVPYCLIFLKMTLVLSPIVPGGGGFVLFWYLLYSSCILYFFFYTILVLLYYTYIFFFYTIYIYIYIHIFSYICIYNRIHFGSRSSLQACMLSCCSDGMELSLIGAFIVLFLCNPVLLVHTYDFWACFGGVCIYFAVVAIIYEAVLSFLFCAVPVCVHNLCQTRLDAKLPMRAGLCLVMLFCDVWHVASLSVPTGHMALY